MSLKPLPDAKEFLTYLNSFAREGETVLVVEQKPNAWKAHFFNPRSKMDPEAAMYANTGSFIKARKTGATELGIEHVLCLMLDDIGTKVTKTPPLQPTWKMETSEGSFQWGYVFSVQPTKGAFSAAVKAIADAGLTDPGACNSVRNFRIPGSINLKKGRNKFASRLIEFNGDLTFTLDEICTAFEVIPGEEIHNSFPVTTTPRDDDEVLDWLREKGLVVSEKNDWVTILCPNRHNHTTGGDQNAKYNPKDRGFMCHHGHCSDLDSAYFLDWVRREGGPDADMIDPKHIFAALAPALEKLEKLEKLNPLGKIPMKNTADGVLSTIGDQQSDRTAKEDIFNRYAYIKDGDCFFSLEDREIITRQNINAMYRHHDCRSIHGGRRIETSIYFDEHRTKMNAEVLKGATYAPGDKVIVIRNGQRYGNVWSDGRPKVDKTLQGDVSTWLDHGCTLFKNPVEMEHILNIMAFKLQHPTKKINHAVLHAGREGCGKDTFWAPFFWSMGGVDGKNKSTLDNTSVNLPWSYHLECEIVLINELKESTTAERLKLANTLKPIIAAPPNTLQIRKKNQHPYEAINRVFVMAFSNSRTPISLSPQDRRWFVIWSEAPQMREADINRIWGWYEKGGFRTIAAWLYQRDVSAFNPLATPMDTEYRQALIEGGMSMAHAFLVQSIAEGSGEFQAGVVGSPFNRLADRLQGSAPAGVKIHHAEIVESLQDAGWVNIGSCASKDHPTKKTVWVSKSMFEKYRSGEHTKSSLRDMLEFPTIIHKFPILNHA